MRILTVIILCAALLPFGDVNAQEQSSSQFGRNIRIQKIVRDILGKRVTLNLKDKTEHTGTLVKADAAVFVLKTAGTEENYPTSEIRSITISPGVSEGLLVALASVLCAGFGVGVAALSFNVESTGIQELVAVVSGIFGGWIGYESFFQETELLLP